MKRVLRMLAATGPFAVALVAGQPAVAQKSGGILRVPWFDSPPSLSLLEESSDRGNGVRIWCAIVTAIHA